MEKRPSPVLNRINFNLEREIKIAHHLEIRDWNLVKVATTVLLNTGANVPPMKIAVV